MKAKIFGTGIRLPEQFCRKNEKVCFPQIGTYGTYGTVSTHLVSKIFILNDLFVEFFQT